MMLQLTRLYVLPKKHYCEVRFTFKDDMERDLVIDVYKDIISCYNSKEAFRICRISSLVHTFFMSIDTFNQFRNSLVKAKLDASENYFYSDNMHITFESPNPSVRGAYKCYRGSYNYKTDVVEDIPRNNTHIVRSVLSKLKMFKCSKEDMSRLDIVLKSIIMVNNIVYFNLDVKSYSKDLMDKFVQFYTKGVEKEFKYDIERKSDKLVLTCSSARFENFLKDFKLNASCFANSIFSFKSSLLYIEYTSKENTVCDGFFVTKTKTTEELPEESNSLLSSALNSLDVFYLNGNS